MLSSVEITWIVCRGVLISSEHCVALQAKDREADSSQWWNVPWGWTTPAYKCCQQQCRTTAFPVAVAVTHDSQDYDITTAAAWHVTTSEETYVNGRC